jgi:hypothetical protein
MHRFTPPPTPAFATSRRAALLGGAAVAVMLLVLAGCLGRHEAMNADVHANSTPLRLVAACNVNPVPVTVTVRTGPGADMPVHLGVSECLNKREHGLTQAGGAGEVLDIRVRAAPAAACRAGASGCS